MVEAEFGDQDHEEEERDEEGTPHVIVVPPRHVHTVTVTMFLCKTETPCAIAPVSNHRNKTNSRVYPKPDQRSNMVVL